jgi:NAD(P)-dependent dehydrogenase (short-subunit alcohol dehydrogenase family)
MPANSTSQKKAWVITGPASGIGYRTALELLAAVPAVEERR